jgi:hypothetical protein
MYISASGRTFNGTDPVISRVVCPSQGMALAGHEMSHGNVLQACQTRVARKALSYDIIQSAAAR